MTIELRAHWLVILALALLATCGNVTPDPDPDELCTWDRSRWDACRLAP